MTIILNLVIVAALGTSMMLSRTFFSPQELQDRFERGQKLYALGDYEAAKGHFSAIRGIESNDMIDVEDVTVTVDEFILPVRTAATYQLANTYNKLGLDKLRRSEILEQERKEAQAKERYQEALADLNQSLGFFQELIVDPSVDERTRVMSQYQTLETNYQLKDYEQVIKEGERLLNTFPNSVYEVAAYYDMAWAHFDLERYEEAIEDYKKVLALSPSGTNVDRSLLQIGDAYERLGRFDEALEYFGRLISRYDFSKMTEDQLRKMKTDQLRGVVEKTARELVATAQLRIGDIHAERGDVDAAVEAYGVIPGKYPAEVRVVQSSYLRSAELIEEHRGVDAGLSAYKQSIREVDDETFQARTQLALARMLFENERYQRAAAEYGVFLDAYGSIAARVGFPQDRALFRIAQSHQSLARQLRDSDAAGADSSFDAAARGYRSVIEQYPDSPVLPDAYFGLGLTRQMQGQVAPAREHFEAVVEKYPQQELTARALMQLARMDYDAEAYADARRRYEEVLAKYPDFDLRDNAHMELALTFRKLGEPKRAIASFEAIDPEWDRWPKIQVELGQLYLDQDQPERALEVFARALPAADGELRAQLHYLRGRTQFGQEDYRAALAELTRGLEATTSESVGNNILFTRGAAAFELAKRLDQEGRKEEARVQYDASRVDMQALLERNPTAYIRDSAFRTLGAGMIRLQRQEEAASYYQSLIDSSPDPQEQATFRMLLTELYFDQGEYERARSQARQLLATDFEDDNNAGYYRKERAYSIIGNTFLREERYPEAAEAFEQGLAQFPDSGESANLAFSLGFAHFNAGQYPAAIEAFQQMISRFPADRNRVHARYYLAHSYQALTQFAKAAAAFKVLIDEHPDSRYTEEALYLVGENYYNERDFEQAAVWYERLLERYPAGSRADASLYALAWCHFERDNMEAGVETMSALVERFPDSDFASRAQFTVGDYHYNLQQYDQAIDAYRVVLSSYSGSPEADKAQNLIKELSEIRASQDYKRVMELFENKQYRQATVGLIEVAQSYPDTYTALAAYCNLGLAYEIQREWPKAVEFYERTLKEGGDDPENADVVSFARQHRDWIVENRL